MSSIPKRLIPIQETGMGKRVRGRLTLFTAMQRNAPQREERSPPEIIFEEFRVRERIYEEPPPHEQMINKYV